MDITIDYIKYLIRDFDLAETTLDVYIIDDYTIQIDRADFKVDEIELQDIAETIYNNDKYRKQIRY